MAKPVSGDESFFCRNPSCGRFFIYPLKVVNLRAEKAESYLACPYCLTEIAVERPSSLDIVSMVEEEKTFREAEETGESVEGKSSEPQAKGQCPCHFGYLGERLNKDQMPEECMVCENILNCMCKPTKS
jgi:hypothetical protein